MRKGQNFELKIGVVFMKFMLTFEYEKTSEKLKIYNINMSS